MRNVIQTIQIIVIGEHIDVILIVHKKIIHQLRIYNVIVTTTENLNIPLIQEIG